MVQGKYFSNDRQIQLFKILFEAKEPLNGNVLGSKLNVSTRTVLTEIKEINSIVNDYGVKIVNKRGLGYKLQCEEEGIKEHKYDEIIKNCIYYDVPLDVEDRAKYIIRKLLEKNGYYTVQQLSEELFVSKQTISNDLKFVRSILKQYSLTLKIKVSYGICIEGEEIKKRKCYSYCLPFRRDEENIYEIGERESKFFKGLDLMKLEGIVEDHINKCQLTTIDSINKILTIHIAISIKRIESKQCIQESDNSIFTNYIEENKVTEQILADVEKEFGVKFSQNEFNYILIYVVCCTKGKGFEKKLANENAAKLTMEFLEYIWEKYRYDFRGNENLLKDLEVHLESLVRRVQFSMKVKNTVLEEIKQKYPIFFDMALTSLKKIIGDIGDGMEDEAGFLALHLAAAEYCKEDEIVKRRVVVVCGSGLGSGRLIEARLKSKFDKYITIEKVMSYSEYSKMKVLNCDFVITTLTLQEKNVPIIKISTLPDNEEIANIINIMESDKESESFILSRFLPEELHFNSYNFKGKEEALEFLCKELETKGYVKPSFRDSVFEREEISCTVIAPGIAMPHPLAPAAKKTGMAVVTLENPMEWNGESVRIIFMLNVSEEDYINLNLFYDKIIKVFNDINTINEIAKAKNSEELIKSLMK